MEEQKVIDENVRVRMNNIVLLSKSDFEYHRMLLEIRELEKKYEAVLQTLPDDQRDIICDFVSQCEGMSWRMLELACTHMRFPE